MATLAPVLSRQFFDNNGDPLVGGKVFTYLAGTTLPIATYTDDSEETPNENPIILDSAGRCNLWLADGAAYKFVITDAEDNVIDTEDQVLPTGSGGGGSAQSPWIQHAITDGQAATTLTGQTVDLAEYDGAIYDCVIKRGTTVMATGRVAIQHLNGTGRVIIGGFMAGEPHGVTFSIDQSETVVTLKAAADSGAGNGVILLSRKLIPRTS